MLSDSGREWDYQGQYHKHAHYHNQIKLVSLEDHIDLFIDKGKNGDDFNGRTIAVERHFRFSIAS